MTRLTKNQRRPLLRRTRDGQRWQSSSERRYCTTLNCVACICLFLNVLVMSLTLMVNGRLKGQGEGGGSVPAKPPVDGSSSSVSTATAATAITSVGSSKSDFKIGSTTGASNYLVPPANPKTTPTQLHIVFQTDCRDPTQDWQAYVFFYHMFKHKQPGEVTRVITGCQIENRRTSLELTHKMQVEPMGRGDDSGPSRFHIHFAPAHPNQADVGNLRKQMKYFNRPFGVYHWMEHVMGYSEAKPSNTHDDTVIIWMDTDMILLRPFGVEFDNQAELWKKQLNPQLGSAPQKASPGHPMAQHTPFPSQWWNDLDVVNTALPVIGPGLTKLQQMLPSDVDNHYATGPPFVVVAKDLYPLVQKWTEVTYPLFKALGERIMREPNGPYALAAADLQKPHQLASSFAVSSFRDEAFGLFEVSLVGQEMSTLLGRPEAQCRKVPTEVKPHVLQYSKRYALGNYIIGKHYMPRKFMGTIESCSAPLFAEPPDNISQLFSYYFDPELKQRVVIEKELHILQMSIMLCETIQAFNEAAIRYKQSQCNAMGTSNLEKTLLFEDGQPNP